METCPDEVLLKICARLDFQTVANLRRVSTRFAEVGAEALVTRVRFHCSQDSLERLHAIASHQVFSKYVDAVVFEGNILANVGCVHTYSAHYELDHHKNERPAAPGRNATEREKRLYERNVVKFTREISQKYDRYRAFYDKQQKVLKSSAYQDLLAPSMLCFPRLNKITLTTIGRCKHVLSERFLEMFAVDCGMPIDCDTKYTKEQLKNLLFPQGRPLTTIRSLEVHVLSPKFFTGFIPRSLLCQAFKNLKVADLNLRLEKEDRIGLDMTTAERCYADLKKGYLRDALGAATELERLTVNFEDFGYYGACINVKHILGDHTWPNLAVLDLDCMSTTQDYLISFLKRHPTLHELCLGYMTLLEGRWTKATTIMRKDLNLTAFTTRGILEDPEQMYPMHLIDADAYMEDFHEFTMANALEIYVTDDWEEGDEYHPLEDEAFADEHELREEFGPFADDEDFSDMDCSE